MRDERTLRLLQIVGLAVLPGVLVAAPPAMGQTGYVVEDLGALAGDTSSVAWAINADGDVVGWSMGPAGTRAFLYTNAGGMVALPGLPDKPRTVARDINDAGVVVGSANAGGTDLGRAVLWSDGAIQDLGTLGTGLYSEAWGVNNLGQVVGWSYTNGASGLQGVHAFLYSPAEGLVDLTPQSDTGTARDINDAGQVTGYKTALGGYHAFRWEAGAFVDLGVLPGFAHSFGWAINSSGQVAGSSTSASGNSERLVRFRDGSGLENLGGTGEHNVALGINALGQVVGVRGNSRALLFTDEAGLQDLNTLIDPSLGWFLRAANDINDAGQIVGYALNNFTGLTHAVRLQPSGPPPECTFRCLISTRIALRSSAPSRTGEHTVRAQVNVKDENGAPVPGALLVGRWTLPDGRLQDVNVFTGARGAALLTTQGPGGSYTLTVVNIVRSQYTFNPGRSVLSESIVVPARSTLRTPPCPGAAPSSREPRDSATAQRVAAGCAPPPAFR
jgi:probable HAF family extracellular repeat protein